MSESLRAAARDIDAIQTEIEARQALVAKLQADATTYKQLVSMNKAQVEAVVSQIQHVVDQSSTQTNRWTTAMTVLAIVVGILVSLVVGFIFWKVGSPST